MDIQETNNTLEKYKYEAGHSVLQKDGQWIVQFQKPVANIDLSITYPSRELAVDAAFTALKNHDKFKVARAA